jgi:hypothetical protein
MKRWPGQIKIKQPRPIPRLFRLHQGIETRPNELNIGQNSPFLQTVHGDFPATYLTIVSVWWPSLLCIPCRTRSQSLYPVVWHFPCKESIQIDVHRLRVKHCPLLCPLLIMSRCFPNCQIETAPTYICKVVTTLQTSLTTVNGLLAIFCSAANGRYLIGFVWSQTLLWAPPFEGLGIQTYLPGLLQQDVQYFFQIYEV